jgi:hypothetical protein
MVCLWLGRATSSVADDPAGLTRLVEPAAETESAAEGELGGRLESVGSGAAIGSFEPDRSRHDAGTMARQRPASICNGPRRVR